MWRNHGACAPTQSQVIGDLAVAAKATGQLPDKIRLAPSAWACLASDYYTPMCKCANCTNAATPMMIGGVRVEIDVTVPEGCIAYDVAGHDSLLAENYAYQTLY